MTNLQQEMGSILSARKARLPAIQAEIARWNEVDAALRELVLAVSDLRDYHQTPEPIRESLRGFTAGEMHHAIARLLEELRIVQTRFARPTINIGVSGQARMGKSTLLQAISGLNDQQIPTGAGIPVTAVRSRIFHSLQHRRAVLTLHTFDSFRQEVLAPYHVELELEPPPTTVEAFANFRYPDSADNLSEDIRKRHSSETALRRVREMQRALPSYRTLLTGGDKSLSLEELRPYVSYPTNDEENASTTSRRYLAVRDVRIECPFPTAEVGALGIIDLPGLGELGSNVESYHLAGLRNEVDLAFLVTRPVEINSFWTKRDSNTANLLDNARGAIKNRRDFVMIVCNSGGCRQESISTMLDDIRRQANGGEDGRHFKVLEVDAANPIAVEENLLLPALRHLAERLPAMDGDVLGDTIAKSQALDAKLSILLKDLEQTLGGVASMAVDVRESLDEHAEALRETIAGDLQDLVDRLRDEARSEREDPQYLKAVHAAYDSLVQWIRNGFDRGKDAWCRSALRTMRVDKNSLSFSGKELNSIRVQISKRYAALDAFFQERVERLLEQVASALRKNLGQLVPDSTGRQQLEALTTLLQQASSPCTTLSDAVRNILAVRLEYRTHLHPRIRQELDELTLQVHDPGAEGPQAQIVVEINEEGAETLFQFVVHLAEKAAYETRKALAAEAVTPTRILLSVLEQFEDELIRSQYSARDFKRLAHAYRDEIWPGEYSGLDEANARYSRVRKAMDVLGSIKRKGGAV